MSAPDITPRVMAEFHALGEGSHLTFLIGAGASAPSGLPDWDEFAIRVSVASGVVPSRDAGALLVDKQDAMIVLQAARQRAGGTWDRLLSEALYSTPEAQQRRPSSLHLAVAGHYDAAPANTTLATLNFDTLLERALMSDSDRDVYSSTSQSAGADGVTVHHLHGIIDGGLVIDPVVSFVDYADQLAAPEAWQRDFLDAALRRGPMLIAGTTYRDPDLRQWLHTITTNGSSPHAAIVTIVREGLRLTRDDFAMLDEALLAEWQSIGLQALALQDFADVAGVIRELAHSSLPEYRAPSERARQVWTQHNRRLTQLQPDYSKLLERDAELFSNALGSTAHRGTLWLAAPRGKLARWASASTAYQSSKQMKRVPTGHDSPWIAGEAMGAETVRLKDVAKDDRVTPHWRSVLAIPIMVSDGALPPFVSAVVTFGLELSAVSALERQRAWESTAREVSQRWGTHLSEIAFHR